LIECTSKEVCTLQRPTKGDSTLTNVTYS